MMCAHCHGCLLLFLLIVAVLIGSDQSSSTISSDGFGTLQFASTLELLGSLIVQGNMTVADQNLVQTLFNINDQITSIERKQLHSTAATTQCPVA